MRKIPGGVAPATNGSSVGSHLGVERLALRSERCHDLFGLSCDNFTDYELSDGKRSIVSQPGPILLLRDGQLVPDHS